MKLSDLAPAPYNPRDITAEALSGLKASLGDFGDLSGITWNSRTGHLVCGHQRLRALQEQHGDELRMVRGSIHTPTGEQFKVREVDWPEEKERAANITANSPLISGAFTGELEDILASLEQDYSEMFAPLRLDEMLGELQPPVPLVDDEVPELPKDPVTQAGDVWVLGDHRVVCGDSTKKDVLFDAMQGEGAHLCLTDPPYGLGGTVSDKNNYDAYEDSKTNLKQIIRDGLPLYRASVETVVLTPGNRNQSLYPRPTWTMAWFTPAGVGRGPWGVCCWQPILCYGPDPKLAARKGAYPDALVHTEAAEKNGHPCAKPIKFWAWLMERSTVDDGDTVLDPFLGSGTTIIAAEQLNRRCFGGEIDPGYCDVIVERWENLTGGKATR